MDRRLGPVDSQRCNVQRSGALRLDRLHLSADRQRHSHDERVVADQEPVLPARSDRMALRHRAGWLPGERDPGQLSEVSCADLYEKPESGMSPIKYSDDEYREAAKRLRSGPDLSVSPFGSLGRCGKGA